MGSATKIKFWFWYVLDRQANFGGGSNKKGGRHVKKRAGSREAGGAA